MIVAGPATEADVLAFFGKRPWASMRARVLKMDGKVVSVAGLAHESGCLQIFWNVAPEYAEALHAWPARRAIARELKIVMSQVAASELPVLARGFNPAMMDRLGFVQVEGGIYQWATMRRSSPRARSSTLARPPTTRDGAPPSP